MSTRQLTIAIDAMGGENSPFKTLKGSEMFYMRQPNVRLVFFGNEKIILETIKKFNISYYHTPFPLINNSEIFWSSLLYLENLYNDQNIYMTIINYDKKFVERPKKIKPLKLKKMSENKKYNINLANKIISEFVETNKSNKSFSISKKRFIPPHQYLVAKDFIKNEKN